MTCRKTESILITLSAPQTRFVEIIVGIPEWFVRLKLFSSPIMILRFIKMNSLDNFQFVSDNHQLFINISQKLFALDIPIIKFYADDFII